MGRIESDLSANEERVAGLNGDGLQRARLRALLGYTAIGLQENRSRQNRKIARCGHRPQGSGMEIGIYASVPPRSDLD